MCMFVVLCQEHSRHMSSIHFVHMVMHEFSMSQMTGFVVRVLGFGEEKKIKIRNR